MATAMVVPEKAQATVQDLQARKRLLQAKLSEARAALESAQKEIETDEAYAVIDSRPPSLKLAKEAADKGRLVESLRQQIAPLDRAIELLQQTAIEDSQARLAARVEKFRRDSAPHVKRLMAAIDNVEDAALEFFEFYERQQGLEILDLMNFLFPARVPSKPLEDMQQRFGRLNVLNAAMGSLANRAKKA